MAVEVEAVGAVAAAVVVVVVATMNDAASEPGPGRAVAAGADDPRPIGL